MDDNRSGMSSIDNKGAPSRGAPNRGATAASSLMTAEGVLVVITGPAEAAATVVGV